MGFLDNIPISSTVGFIGLGLLVLGGFMVLAGLDIIRIEKITVRQGRTTWVVGVVFAVIGIALLYPELVPSKVAAETDTGSALVPTTGPVPTAAQVSAAESAAIGLDWTSVGFQIPSGGLWSKTDDGSYMAQGSKDTIAWSEEVYEGGLELELTVESPSGDRSPTVLVYGDGQGFSRGVLIFAVANDYQWIAADTPYNGRFLAVAESQLDSDGQTHTLGIRVADGRATLSWDGLEMASASLGDDVNSSGKVGLFKYWEHPSATYSNVRIRVPGEGDQ